MSTTADAPAGHELFSYKEAAAYLGPGFTVVRLKEYVNRTKILTAVRIGNLTFIRRSELDRLVRLSEGAPPPRSRKAK